MKNFFLKWWKDHKLKTLGGLAMAFGAAQMNFQYIRYLIPVKYQGGVLFGFGMAAAVFGFLNRTSQPPP